MAEWGDVREVVRELPETHEGEQYGEPTWTVRGETFAWVYPLRGEDLDELGESAPDGDVLALATELEGEPGEMLEAEPDLFFTVSRFDGGATVLLRLDEITPQRLEEVLVSAWLARAPESLADAFLAERELSGPPERRDDEVVDDILW